MARSESGAVALYESLARFQWWRARRGVAADRLDGLELRKRLAPPQGGDGPADGAAGLDAWLQTVAGGCAGARVLDLGCGFGASLLRAVDAGAREGVGLTPSPYQIARARSTAAARGVDARCRFEVADLGAPLPASDLVFAIESLGHVEDLGAVLGRVAACLEGASAGRLLWLEDCLTAAADDDPDVRALASAWSSPPLRSVAAADDALALAGLVERRVVDLTPQVPRRALDVIDAAIRRTSRLRRLLPLPFARRVLAAFEGGLHLERLYARGLACYRLVMAERVQEQGA